MRTGVIVAGAIAVAASATAGLMGAGLIGAQPRKANSVTAESAQAAVRQVRTVPVAPPAPIAPVQALAPVTTPQPAPIVEARPVPAAPQPPIETTASIGGSPRTLVVNGSRVALRESPSSSGKLIDRLPAGQKVVELSRNGDWVRVRLSGGGSEGWVSSTLVGAKPRS